MLASSDSALLPQSVGDKHRMSFPETVDEILDVSEDEGEGGSWVTLAAGWVSVTGSSHGDGTGVPARTGTAPGRGAVWALLWSCRG